MRFNVLNLLLGLSLALLTAINCVSYEKIVKSHGYTVICFLNFVLYAIFGLVIFLCSKPQTELIGLWNNTSVWKHVGIYLATCITSVIWYYITRRTDVANGSVYEIAYVPFLVLIYWLFNMAELSLPFVGGTGLVVAGVLLITWSQK